MTKVMIRENERGLLYKNGKFIKMLNPGCHRYIWPSYEINVVDINEYFTPLEFMFDNFQNDPSMLSLLDIIEVSDGTLVLHYKNGNFDRVLTPGKYAFWKIFDEHQFQTVSIEAPMVDAKIPPYIFAHIPAGFYRRCEVLSHQKGLLYYDEKFIQLLEPGTYFFWENGIKIRISLVDTRLIQMNIQGQEILTLDKVTLRINFVCRYKINDYLKVQNEINDYEEQIRVICQLALREYTGRFRLDEILQNKEDMASFVFSRLKEHEQACFVTFFDAGVKDIILPGEIRDIMNTVLIAEKRAQANVITRREEVASTRSLLNTAKLMEENRTLMRLKEMEYLEKICENVGSITVNGGGSLFGELAALVKGE